MLISEYLALRNQISVTTGNTVVQPANGTAKDAVQGGSFAEALQEKLNENTAWSSQSTHCSGLRNAA